MNHRASRYAPLLLLTLLLIPLAQAFTIDGPTNFQSAGGGNVRYQITPTISRINIVNTLTRFTGLRLGGVNRGNLGFDCDTDVNMTITGITQYTITYTIETGLGPAVDSYVYYRRSSGLYQLTSPLTVIGGTWTYDDGLGILTVATTGSPVLVTIVYGLDTGSPLIEASNVIWALMPFLVLVISFDDYRREEFGAGTLMKIVLTGVIIAFFAWLFRAWGF